MRHLLTPLILATVTTTSVWAATPLAPAPARDVSAYFYPGHLYGLINFTAPNTNASGNPIEENLTFTVYANGEEIVSKPVFSGVSRAEEIEVSEKGEYTLSIVISNQYGNSDPVEYKVGAGYYPPEAPRPMAFRNEEGTVTISWPNVRALTDGTSVSDGVTYDVVRLPDAKVIATGIKENSVKDTDLDGNLHAYYYAVTAIRNYTRSEEGEAGPVVVGTAVAPWSCDFSDTSDLDYFRIIDGNKDGYTWFDYYGEVACNNSSSSVCDDWLISPPIKLEKGAIHTFTVDVRVRDAAYPSKIEVLYGYSPDRDDLTEVAIPVTWYNNQQLKTLSGTITSETGEPVYIALHNVTGTNGWTCMATNMSVGRSTEGAIPMAPSDFTAVPDIDGGISIDLSLVAPTLDISDEEIPSLIKVDLYRDDNVLIKSFDNPAPGATLTFTDNTEAGLTEGEHTYKAIATSTAGEGIPAKLTTWAGLRLPATPEWAEAVETDDFGWITISWAPVTTNEDGNPLRPEDVTYSIYTNITGQDMLLLNDLKETSITFQIMIPEQEQLFWQFGITASNAAGENTLGIMTRHIPIGEPWTLPYEDSFPDLSSEYSYIEGGSESSSYWTNGSDKTFEEMTTFDGDNGMFYMYGAYEGSTAYLHSAKVSLKDIDNPVMTFYVYNYWDKDPNENTIEVLINADRTQGFKSLGKWTLSDFNTEGWHRIEIPLTEYVGMYPQFQIIGTTNSYQYIQLDNLQIRDRHDLDLAVRSVDYTDFVKSGNAASFNVEIANYGMKPSGEFTLNLSADGNVVASKKLTSIPSDVRVTEVLNVDHTVLTPETVSYVASVVYDADQDKTNNTFKPLEVFTIFPNYPVVSDLLALYPDEDPSTVTLSWSKPDLDTAFSDETTETFEQAAPWTSNVDGWTFIDVDKQFIFGFESGGFEPPYGAPTAMSRQSWWILDAEYQPMVDHFSDPKFYKAHSGHQYMISMAVTDAEYKDMKTDDWAISPELCGASQTISFWAKSMLEDALDDFEIYYSTTTPDLSEFERLQSVTDVPWSWTQYYFPLPEGAKYFAIRASSIDGYVLMVDDIKFIPAGKGADLEIEGYNVYRGSERLNDTPVKEGSFVVKNSSKDAVYRVTTLYAGRGESGFSNEATPKSASVEYVDLDRLSVSASAGMINVSGAAGARILVFAADGRTVADLAASGADHISVPAGIYVVNVAGKSFKLIVK